jgi:hypothetical protein
MAVVVAIPAMAVMVVVVSDFDDYLSVSGW